jgi:hypothetical protein
MDILPIAGDHVRVRVGHSFFDGVVAHAYESGGKSRVTIEIHLPDVEPYTATFPLEYVEPAPAT